MQGSLVDPAPASCALHQWSGVASTHRFFLVVLLTLHGGLLAYSATHHSPTHLEPAFLASGISHWKLGRFELYRVNPPLPRMLAALPAIAVGCTTDWSRFYVGPGCRPEFMVGEDFIRVNQPRSHLLVLYARWACIPFSLIGGYYVYRWSYDLYGTGAANFSLALWAFSPNLFAHAELVTPDSACTSLGIAANYWFWRWLRAPNWPRACLAGLCLGVAELTKMSWLILFALWPLLWAFWNFVHRYRRDASVVTPVAGVAVQRFAAPSFTQLAATLIIAMGVINVGYLFDGSLTPLRQFEFVSQLLSAPTEAGIPGNRFQDTLLGELPVPLPRQFVLGLDQQRRDLEDFGQPSYLRGRWSETGWWYYYLYGLLVKVPCGTLGIFGLAILRRAFSAVALPLTCNDIIVLSPSLALICLVSSHTEFSHHLRYVFPALGLMVVFLGSVVATSRSNVSPSSRDPSSVHVPIAPRRAVYVILPVLMLGSSVTSFALHFPHQLCYFNELAGGPASGWKHLLGSSFDWGQDQIQIVSQVEQLRNHWEHCIWIRDIALPTPSMPTPPNVVIVRTPRQMESQMPAMGSLLVVQEHSHKGNVEYRRALAEALASYTAGMLPQSLHSDGYTYSLTLYTKPLPFERRESSEESQFPRY